jgi:hypothetical protein
MLMGDWGYPGVKREPDNPCDGCHECGLRCTAGIQMQREEFDRIVELLRASDPAQVDRVLNQEKTILWFEDIRSEACLFYDVTRRGCLVYPARPLICRLFGRVEWLPCPLNRPLRLIQGWRELIQTYTSQRRTTFAEWCTEAGIFDFRQLTRS